MPHPHRDGRLIGDATGQPLRYEEIPAEVAAYGMAAHGFPEAVRHSAHASYTRQAKYAAPITGEVERILGRPARTIAV